MAPNTLQQNQQGTMNDLRKFVQDMVKMGGLDKLAEMQSQNANDKSE